ncbi:MAG: sulfatase-like hydrolase/transferase [Bacteroidetes bacterium]|nr:sulfatase-like hydrolase/transferase [Bacteroidota bacterium]
MFLESWTADVVECLGGEKSVAPRLGKLAEEGILFTNFYSTGYRTEQGLLAMLSAFPAQPQSSVIYNWGTFDKLPNLFRTMNNNGYYTSFYYGGRLQFDNVEAYLRSAGVKLLAKMILPFVNEPCGVLMMKKFLSYIYLKFQQ